MTISRFISKLVAFDGDATFNPYTDICNDFDRKDAPRIRRANLRSMLTAAMEDGATTIWVARDLGYRGGRRTGLALTDEAHLNDASIFMGGAKFSRATKGPAMAERTATVMWETLLRIKEPVMLWNVFPFHPHEADKPMSNRSHTRRERDRARPFLYDLLELITPEKVIAVGRDAALAMEGVGVPVEQVRHPSYGGQTEFIRQVEVLYGLSPLTQEATPTRSLALI